MSHRALQPQRRLSESACSFARPQALMQQAPSTVSQHCRRTGSRTLGCKHGFTIRKGQGQWALRLQALLHDSTVGGLASLQQATTWQKLHAHTDVRISHAQGHVALQTETAVTRVRPEAVKAGAEAIAPEKVLTCPRPLAARQRQTTDRAPCRWLLQPARCRPSWSLDPSAVACDACLGPPSRSLCPTLPSFCPPLQHRQCLTCVLRQIGS